MTLDAAYFDGWYADMTGSPAKDEILRRHLGLPPELLSTSMLSWDGIADVVAALELPAGGVLLDLACGRGGYGREIAGRAGAKLVGVDFSAEAVRQAAGIGGGDFRVGQLTATGLDDSCVDAAVCIDAVQFAETASAAYAELRRVVRPGGRIVLTGWEPVEPGDERLAARLRTVDLARGLTEAGFGEVEVRERKDWRALERGLWEEAAALDPGDDAALRSLHDEGVGALTRFDLVRRVSATARA